MPDDQQSPAGGDQPVVPSPPPAPAPAAPPVQPAQPAAGGDQPVVPPPAPAAPPAQPAQPAAGGGGRGRGEDWNRFMSLLPNVGLVVLGVLGITLVLSIVLGLFIRSSIVRELASPDLARGVITFIFAVGTVGIALLLAVGALVGQHSVEEFAKAKEILTVLIGVFGTILGFYFGTAAGGGQKLDIAEMRLTDKQLMTHVAG